MECYKCHDPLAPEDAVPWGNQKIHRSCLQGYQRASQERYRRRHGIPERVQFREDAEGRECTECRVYKPWSEFHSASTRLDPERAGKTEQKVKCRECFRWYNMERRHGITREQYEQLLADQEAVCYICGLPETKADARTGTVWLLSVDHDHSCCGELKSCPKCLRGLLCAHCNRTIIGRVEMSPRLAARFADYLERRPLLASG
jgi:hypothetical protein